MLPAWLLSSSYVVCRILSQNVQEDVEKYYEAYICLATMFAESDLKVKYNIFCSILAIYCMVAIYTLEVTTCWYIGILVAIVKWFSTALFPDSDPAFQYSKLDRDLVMKLILYTCIHFHVLNLQKFTLPMINLFVVGISCSSIIDWSQEKPWPLTTDDSYTLGLPLSWMVEWGICRYL